MRLVVRLCLVEQSLCPSSIPRSVPCRTKLSPATSLKPHLNSSKASVDGDQATTLIVLKPAVKISPWLWLCSVAAACCSLGCVFAVPSASGPWENRSTSISKQGEVPCSFVSLKGVQYTVVLNYLCSLYCNKLWGNNSFPEVTSTALTPWEIWSAQFLVLATAHEITTIKCRGWMKEPFSSTYTAIILFFRAYK